MDTNSSSYGTSWADQWDYGPDPDAVAPSFKHDEKTKNVAAKSLKKVKQDTKFSVNWIKQKYNSRK